MQELERIRIVHFEPAMADALAALWVNAWSKTMSGIDFAARRPWLLARLEDFRERSIEIAAAEDAHSGELLGFLTLDPQTGEIDQLAAAPGYWGQGIGQVLIAYAKSARPQGLWLTVNQDNPRAVAFYERSGFRRSAEGINPMSGLRTWRYIWGPQGAGGLNAGYGASI